MISELHKFEMHGTVHLQHDYRPDTRVVEAWTAADALVQHKVFMDRFYPSGWALDRIVPVRETKEDSLKLMLAEIERYVNEEGVSDTAKVIRIQGAISGVKPR